MRNGEATTRLLITDNHQSLDAARLLFSLPRIAKWLSTCILVMSTATGVLRELQYPTPK